MAKPWQQALLSSGLPLETDVLAYLKAKRCIAHLEYSYLKPDERAMEREFSYDIDASYIRDKYLGSVMVECKYRHPGALWIFAPDQYGGPRENDKTDFLHPFDHFVPLTFPFTAQFPRQLAPACSKGIEVLTDGVNEKTIAQAVNQLAYAFAPKIVSTIDNQVTRWLADDYIFLHVPVIATTAPLFRLNDGVRIEDIRGAAEIEQIATKQPCLILFHSAGPELQQYNMRHFLEVRRHLGDKRLKGALRWPYSKDLDHFFSVIAGTFCPRAFVVVTVEPTQTGFDKVFKFIDDVIRGDVP